MNENREDQQEPGMSLPLPVAGETEPVFPGSGNEASLPSGDAPPAPVAVPLETPCPAEAPSAHCEPDAPFPASAYPGAALPPPPLPEPLVDEPVPAAGFPDVAPSPVAPESAAGGTVAVPMPHGPSVLLRTAAFFLGLLLMAGSCFVLYRLLLVPSERRDLVLFFSDFRQERLRAAVRTVANPADDAALLRILMQELSYGPVANDTLPSLPAGTVLLGAWIHNNTAYVDFSRELYLGLGTEGRAEYLVVYSIVTTVCRNLPSIKNVRILVAGGTLPTLRGLTRIDGPLQPRADLLPKE